MFTSALVMSGIVLSYPVCGASYEEIEPVIPGFSQQSLREAIEKWFDFLSSSSCSCIQNLMYPLDTGG